MINLTGVMIGHRVDELRAVQLQDLKMAPFSLLLVFVRAIAGLGVIKAGWQGSDWGMAFDQVATFCFRKRDLNLRSKNTTPPPPRRVRNMRWRVPLLFAIES